VISSHVVNPVRRSNALRILAEVVCVDLVRLDAPLSAIVLEIADKFLFLGIYADYRVTSLQELALLFLDVLILRVAIGMGWPGKSLSVDLQRIPIFFNNLPTVE
jgi:hypothetical protein